tara:strand:- start:201 stop:2351 length:2151 start_codon:yes stop_codon:yes gene_type:complete
MSSSKSPKEKIQEAFSSLQSGNLINAEKIYLDCINNGIANNVVYGNLGAIYLIQREWNHAIPYLKQALLLKKDDADALNNLAIAYKEIKDFKLAFEYAFNSIRIHASNPNYHKTLALIYLDSGDIINSIHSLNKVIELNPNSFQAYSLLGNTFKLQKNYFLATKNYQKALLIKSNHLESIIGLGQLSLDQYQFEIAIKYFKKAINIQKNNYKALHGLATTYAVIGNHQKAKLLFKEVLLINPNFEAALINLGHIQFRNNDYLNAIRSYEKAFKINPLQKSLIIHLLTCKANICDWSEYNNEILLFESIDSFDDAISPMLFMSFQDKPDLNLTRSRNFYLQNFKREEKKIIKVKKSKIRIAYFSANFNNHPVTLLIKYILKLHNRDQFEVFAYSYSAFKEDEYTKEIRTNVDKYININRLDDVQAVNIIRGDSIDIAIDLMGYTTDTRFTLFSYRVAPIQISYLGYPGTSGSDCMDYLIADKFLIPESHKRFYSEEILYLSKVYLANDDRLIPKGKENKEENNLPKDKFIFTSFNNNYKITKTIFDTWLDILLAFDESVLWLFASNSLSKNNLLKYAKKKGVSSNRFIFAEKVSIEAHLNRHQSGDVFLDTCYYSSGCTAWFSLAAGVPIVTLCGKSYTARMSSSLLNALNLNELITYNLNDYKKIALKLAEDKDYLFDIKSKLNLSLKDSTIFNSILFAKELDSLFKKVYYKTFNN